MISKCTNSQMVQTFMSLHAYQFCALQTFCRPRAYIKQSKCISFKCSSATGGGPSALSTRAKERRCIGRHRRRFLRPCGRCGGSGGRRRHHDDFRRPSGTAAAGCGGCKTKGGDSGGSSRAGGQRRADMRSGLQRRGIGRGGGGGMGPGVRAAGGASAHGPGQPGRDALACLRG